MIFKHHLASNPRASRMSLSPMNPNRTVPDSPHAQADCNRNIPLHPSSAHETKRVGQRHVSPLPTRYAALNLPAIPFAALASTSNLDRSMQCNTIGSHTQHATQPPLKSYSATVALFEHFFEEDWRTVRRCQRSSPLHLHGFFFHPRISQHRTCQRGGKFVFTGLSTETRIGPRNSSCMTFLFVCCCTTRARL